MFFSRRGVVSRGVRSVLALGLLTAFASLAQAQTGTPIKLLVGFPAGAGTDAIARTLAEKLKDELGVPVVVENRAGAGGQIAAQALKASPADGHTFFLTHDHSISILPQVVKKPGYAPQQDFTPLGGFATFVNGLAVSPGTPVKSVPEFVEWVKAQGGKGSVGIPAPASTPEFLVQLIGKRYGLDLTTVPYKGSAPMMADMLGNQIPAGVGSVQDFIEYQRAGKLQMIAVLGAQRQTAMPDVPTLDEAGLKGFNIGTWFGILAPAGTPKEVAERLNTELVKIIHSPEFRKRMEEIGADPIGNTQEQMAQQIKSETEKFAKLVKDGKVSVD